LIKTFKILLIGPLPPPPGGTQVSFKCLADVLKKQRATEFAVINTLGIRGRGVKGVLRFFSLLGELFRQSKRCDLVSLHASTTGLPYMLPFVYLASCIHNKPLIVRKFGGGDYLHQLNNLSARFTDLFIKRADLYLVQTKQLVEASHNRHLSQTRWFPNYRLLPNKKHNGADGGKGERICKKFVYVGHVRENKGMLNLAEAALLLPKEITVDVYGPWFNDLPINVFTDVPNILYKGSLEPDSVIDTISNYDAFVFPTKADTEGHPGVLIEAYMAGLPVVTTDCGSIKEIVDESVGIIVEHDNPQALANAMIKLYIEPAYYSRLKTNTKLKAQLFSAETRALEFVDLCREAIEIYKKKK